MEAAGGVVLATAAPGEDLAVRTPCGIAVPEEVPRNVHRLVRGGGGDYPHVVVLVAVGKARREPFAVRTPRIHVVGGHVGAVHHRESVCVGEVDAPGAVLPQQALAVRRDVDVQAGGAVGYEARLLEVGVLGPVL